MTNLEIHNKIDQINKQIIKILQPNEFTLMNLIVELTTEIRELQAQCTHKFIDGYCEYCYKEKEE